MSLSSKAYWELRAFKDYAKLINKTEDFINTELSKFYTEASKEITSDIESFYQKYATKNGLTLQEAKKRINSVDLKNIDIQVAWASSKQGLRPATDEAFKAKSRITRLELLQYQVDSRVAKLYDAVQESVYEYLYHDFEDSYFRALAIAGDEFGADMTLLNKKAIDNAILQNWSSKNFSERIWGHRQKLGIELRKTITIGLTKGIGVDKMTQQIVKRMDVKITDAKRLVRTESNYCFNKGSIDGYIESGIVEEYKYLATLDNRTSPQCINLDGQVFPLREATVGTNCPPMHPNCRSTTVAYFGDISGKNRRAKADGKSYLVDADLNYKDWYSGLSDSQRSNMEIDLKMLRNEKADNLQFSTYKKLLGADAPKDFDSFQKIKYTDKNGYNNLKGLSSYLRYNHDSDKKFYEINKAIQENIAKGLIDPKIGTAVKPISDTIASLGKHSLNRMNSGGVTQADAQSYIDNAVVMFKQFNGKRFMYYSEDGASGLMKNNQQLVTVFPKSWYDSGSEKIIEVSKK